MIGVAYAQVETAVDAALKLAQGGTVVILIFFIIGLAFAVRKLFLSHQENSAATIKALVENTKAMETHTRALEATERATTSQRESIAAMQNLLDTLMRQRQG